ncbi:MAG: metal/formaldehyde-sensitive transcriptional repressor [Acidobacteriota bacterium]|nr:metal/formaldehyde-sensitive transcriptional repressor [Acidobacteriota bacterium]
MAHTEMEKKKLLNRARRIRGQVEALEKAIAEDAECDVVLQQIAACRGAMGGLMSEVVEGHIRFHVVSPEDWPSGTKAIAAQELIDVLKTYLR